MRASKNKAAATICPGATDGAEEGVPCSPGLRRGRRGDREDVGGYVFVAVLGVASQRVSSEQSVGALSLFFAALFAVFALSALFLLSGPSASL